MQITREQQTLQAQQRTEDDRKASLDLARKLAEEEEALRASWEYAKSLEQVCECVSV